MSGNTRKQTLIYGDLQLLGRGNSRSRFGVFKNKHGMLIIQKFIRQIITVLIIG